LSEKNILLIGPYISKPLGFEDILEIGESMGVLPDMQKILDDYYSSVPIIFENDRIFEILDVFCGRIWQTSLFDTVEIVKNHMLNRTLAEPIACSGEKVDEVLENAKIQELRYNAENKLIDAVRSGNYHKDKVFFSFFNEKMLESRLSDKLRNIKNYCIIMNTLFRKAAEQGGVHPVYIDKMSSDFAKKIEQSISSGVALELMKEMFSSYCRLVHRNNTEKYSSVVKNTLLVINSDISAELSLAIIAKKLEVSAGYLATVFKKEIGKTISEYVREIRMRRATELLESTNLQIQTIAMHCGIIDVQYFSKIFKKHIGKTPKEYRETIKA
jgi:YesN/AraC family two-component response regulator